MRRPLGCAGVPDLPGSRSGSANPLQPTPTSRLLSLQRAHRPGMGAPKSHRIPGGVGQLISCPGLVNPLATETGLTPSLLLLAVQGAATRGRRTDSTGSRAKPRPSTSGTEPVASKEAWPGVSAGQNWSTPED
ncbi:hypothetical protein E2320_010245 [Naja naja]|nr:hypothetical protein E2320_010245 [Naja naja]